MALAANEVANQARQSIVTMTSRANASHVGSALSVVDILASLFCSEELIVSHESGFLDSQLILSKGHAAAALYSVLAVKGIIPEKWLDEYCQNGAILGGHVTSKGIAAIPLSTGSLGHGLPYGTGIALGAKLNKKNSRCFVVMSDGECDEGTTWESALFAAHQQLENLCVIIDRNKLQSLMSTELTMGLEPLPDKWRSIGWEVREIDGHNYDEIENAIKIFDRPICIIANTTTGKGVSFMENSVLWHYRPPNQEELELALTEITALG